MNEIDLEKKRIIQESAKMLGSKIQLLRKSKGLSLMQLATKLNVSDTALSKIETAKTASITIELGKGIAEALGVSFNELFEIEIPDGGKNEKNLISENEQLKKENQELKSELLKDKRKLVEFLSINNLLNDVAMGLYHNSPDYDKDRVESWEHLKNGDMLFSNMPYDKDNPQSVIDYILKHIKV